MLVEKIEVLMADFVPDEEFEEEIECADEYNQGDYTEF